MHIAFQFRSRFLLFIMVVFHVKKKKIAGVPWMFEFFIKLAHDCSNFRYFSVG